MKLHAMRGGWSRRWIRQPTSSGSSRCRARAYRAASFLDDRLFQLPQNAAMLPWPQVAAAVPADARADARWIFHIGHVGSTLVARLLGELDGVLSIREPRILRDVALIDGAKRSTYIPQLQKLFSRTFAPTETALIKATSFVSEIAGQLIPLKAAPFSCLRSRAPTSKAFLPGKTRARNCTRLLLSVPCE